ncbi:MAG: ABC transporter substrate-binding protein [Clostridia bacterium]|nr:ABC transporter substrate-binding protein [Clostridia bacterium]
MKEKIYMIPVNDAFNTNCECPVCTLEKDLENKSIEFILGPSSMEPDTRVTTNEKGFCRRHWQMLYTRRMNVLGLSLVLDTHIQIQMNLYKKMFEKSKKAIESDSNTGALSNLANQVTKKSTATTRFIDDATQFLDQLEGKCEICDRMDTTMDRYFDVLFWMYFKDEEFREKVKNSKGFCLRHYNMLFKSAKKYLSTRQLAQFTLDINTLMMDNMDRILDEVQWFAQKFDHRNEKASWKNSEDAVPRTIEKFVSYGNFK